MDIYTKKKIVKRVLKILDLHFSNNNKKSREREMQAKIENSSQVKLRKQELKRNQRLIKRLEIKEILLTLKRKMKGLTIQILMQNFMVLVEFSGQ